MSLGYRALRIYNKPERWFQNSPVTFRLLFLLAAILACLGLDVVLGKAVATFWYHFDDIVARKSFILTMRFATIFTALCLGMVDLMAIKFMCGASMRQVFEKKSADAKKQRLFGRVVRTLNVVAIAMLALFAISGLLAR